MFIHVHFKFSSTSIPVYILLQRNCQYIQLIRELITCRIRAQWLTASDDEATRIPPFATVVNLSEEKLFPRILLAGPCGEVDVRVTASWLGYADHRLGIQELKFDLGTRN